MGWAMVPAMRTALHHLGIVFALTVLLASGCDDVAPSGDGDGDVDASHDGGGGDGDGDIDGDGDGDGDVDGDGDIEPRSSSHESFVPDDLRPSSAARLVVLGDSISAGGGATAPSRPYFTLLRQNHDGAWPEESGNDLVSRFGGSVPLINVAQGGATTADLAGQLEGLEDRVDTPASGHTIVVLTIGGNDLQDAIVRAQAPDGPVLDRAVERLAELSDWFDETRFPDGVSIYVAAVYDPSDGVAQIPGCFFGVSLPGFVEALDVWRERYIALGRERGFAVVDALGHFQGHGHHHDDPENPYHDAEDPTGWFDDCIHPNDRGHSEIRRLFLEAIDGTYVAD